MSEPICIHCRDNKVARCDDLHCDIAGPGEPGNPNQCRICWIRLGRNPLVVSKPKPKPCIHLGQSNNRFALCNTCNGKVQIKLHNCKVHGQCSPNKILSDVASCQHCSDYSPLTSSSTRNLLFHIQPLSNHGVWQRWVLHLLKRMDLFNGKRAVAILTGDGYDPPEKVQEAFRGTIDHFIVTSNDSNLRETKTLFPLLQHVKTTDPKEATFWGHCKGITQQVSPGSMSHIWGRVMLESCLDYWPLVSKLLEGYSTAGSFKKVGWSWGSSSWHYAGSFFWFRNAELFKRNWTKIDTTWWGIETYPGSHFRENEAATIFYQANAWEINPYLRGHWVSKILPAWKKWKEEHKHERTDWKSLTKREAT